MSSRPINPFLKPKHPIEEPASVASTTRGGRGGRKNSAGRGRGKSESAAEQPAARNSIPQLEVAMADVELTPVHQKMISNGEAEYNALPDDKKKVIDRVIKEYDKEHAFYLISHFNQGSHVSRSKGDRLQPGALYTLLVDGINLGASPDDLAALFHEIDTDIEPKEISESTIIQPPRQSADLKSLNATVEARVTDILVTQRLSEFAAGTLDVSGLSAMAQNLIIRGDHDMSARLVISETPSFILLRDMCHALGMAPHIFEEMILSALRQALPSDLKNHLVAVRAEEHTFVSKSDGKRTKMVPVSAGWNTTRTLVYTKDKDARDQLVSRNSLSVLNFGSHMWGMKCQVFLQRLRPKDEHLSMNGKALQKREGCILQEVRENYPDFTLKRLTFDPDTVLGEQASPFLNKWGPSAQEQEASKALGGLAWGVIAVVLPRTEQNQLNHRGPWHAYVLDSPESTFGEQLKARLTSKGPAKTHGSNVFNSITATTVEVANIELSAPQVQPTSQISSDELIQILISTLLDRPQYLYSETANGDPLITNERDGTITSYDSIGQIGPSGHNGYPDIRVLLNEQAVPESVFFESLFTMVATGNVLMIDGDVGGRPVWYICHAIRKPSLPSVAAAEAPASASSDKAADQSMKQD